MKSNKIFLLLVSLCGSTMNCLWGGFDIALNTLLLFMLLDYILGVACGVFKKELSSKIAFRGILKKVAMLMVIAVGVSLDLIINAEGFLRGLVLFFYIGLEGISILENSATIGVPIPNKLTSVLLQLKDND